MKYIDPSTWWKVPAVVLPAAAIAACSPALIGGPAGLRMAVMGLLPASVVLASHLYPRWWAPFAGAVLGWACFCTVLALLAQPAFWKWTGSAWLNPISLLTAVSALSGAVIGWLGMFGSNHRRRVGRDLPAGACRRCGYDARRAKVCPECGAPNPHATI